MPKTKVIRLNVHKQPTPELLRRADVQLLKEFWVQRVLYTKLSPPGKPSMLKISYLCWGGREPLELVKEVACFEHTGYARKKAESWWKTRTTLTVPSTVDEALTQTSALREPAAIEADISQRPYSIVQYFGDLKKVV